MSLFDRNQTTIVSTREHTSDRGIPIPEGTRLKVTWIPAPTEEYSGDTRGVPTLRFADRAETFFIAVPGTECLADCNLNDMDI